MPHDWTKNDWSNDQLWRIRCHGRKDDDNPPETEYNASDYYDDVVFVLADSAENAAKTMQNMQAGPSGKYATFEVSPCEIADIDEHGLYMAKKLTNGHDDAHSGGTSWMYLELLRRHNAWKAEQEACGDLFAEEG